VARAIGRTVQLLISNGAVSGNWWKGKRYFTDNGYAMVNLYNDGSFENEYVPYGFTV
jgi:hypothetical protein